MVSLVLKAQELNAQNRVLFWGPLDHSKPFTGG